ncbi:retrovirus-related pol polyprotein from transposon TNT 1-94 [Tanacetum coccineum]|uniref:Retrovirus-related pol polyprotein from transposon TNT 1-94 n=1 Tax=Tanacetum coccineum TaxID=301880 RepID=A0ABQ5JBJ2_9ASTR
MLVNCTETCFARFTSRLVLQGLPQDFYNLVNHNEHAKEIWDRVKLLIQGSELSLQERESKLYDDFDTFTSIHGETIHSYYMQFAQLINDMHMIGMTMKPLQVNTKFVNHLLPEWSKVVTDVKLAKDMHTTNFDHLYAHLRKHEAHANEVRLQTQRYLDQIALVSNSPSSPAIQQSSSIELDLGLVVLSFNPSDDLIANLNKLMAFVTTTFAPRYPPTNNHLRTSSNPRNQATIQDGRVTVQTVQGRKTQGYANNEARNIAINMGINRQGAAVQPRVVNCYNCQEENHYARQCTNPKGPRTQLAFQTDDLDAFDPDSDKAPSAKAVLMANLSSYDSDVLSEVPFHDTNIENDMSYQSVQETQCSEQPFVDNDIEINITSDSNIVFYEQYLQETENPVVQSTSSPVQQDELLMSVIEEMSSRVAKCNKVQQENLIVNETLTAELEYKEQENDHLFELLFSQDIVHICVNSLATLTNYAKIEQDYIDEYRENLMLKAELAKKEHMVEKKIFDEVVLRCSRLENHCANLELKLQHQKETKLDAKDVSIANLRKHIESLKGKNVVEKDVTPNHANVIAP